ncbi:MAG: M3 family oligoendopeptidase [Bdellovibrionales bacterium]|jgi:oligoendopeptidase F|nr:M3 family oligoendopeptidase [Bdellovibrionales bacterium]
MTAAIDQNKVPVWNNEHLFSSVEDSRFNAMFEAVESAIPVLQQGYIFLEALVKDEHFSLVDIQQEQLKSLQKLMITQLDDAVKMHTLFSYTHMVLSTDAKSIAAQEMMSRLMQLGTSYDQASKSLELYLIRCEQEVIEVLLDHPEVQQYRFSIEQDRKERDFLLNLEQEKMASSLAQSGLFAWGNLYNSLTGTIQCDVDGEKMGLARAANLLSSPNSKKRKDAWSAIQASWVVHEESAAAIVNALNGWRWENNRLRSQIRERHYLDVSCSQSRIERDTLEAILSSTYEMRGVGQRALNLMSKNLSLDKLGPWDLFAPPKIEGEEELLYEFPEAISMIEVAFSDFDPEMGKFARMMYDKGWIDGRESDSRTTGAYCTSLPIVKEPRVFITYKGSLDNIITLAHELGHAYHNWVMRDLPFLDHHYSMTLAETASIFAETLFRDYFLGKSQSREEKLKISWADADSASAMLNNIPARYEFERNFVELRKEQFVPAPKLKEVMKGAWEKWYGDSLQSYDEMFWASKGHFSMAGIGFYNYPYLFGYLFSLGLYALKDQGDFRERYINLLRDTGRMTAEDLVKKHLGEDLTKPTFWQQSLAIVERSVDQFAKLV